MEIMNYNMKKLLPTSFGFTLIELLVVVAIIAVLAIMGFAAFGGLTGKGNDGRRVADIKAIADSLEVARAKISGASVYSPIDTTFFAGGIMPNEPTTRTIKYCYKDGTSSIANTTTTDFGIGTTEVACPTGWTSLNAAASITPTGCSGGVGSTTGCTATYFKVCTFNELKNFAICQGSRQ